MNAFRTRLAAALGSCVLLAGLVMVISRPVHSTGGPVPVTITNSPVPTLEADNQPIQHSLSPSSGSSSSASDTYIVPAGKRLVIEYISAQLTQYPSGGYATLYLNTIAGGNPEYYKVVAVSSSTLPENQLVRIYADAGSTVTGYVAASSGTSCGGSIIFSGHLVNMP